MVRLDDVVVQVSQTTSPPSPSPAVLTRQLQRLDAVQITDHISPSSVDTSSCRGPHKLTRPPYSLAETFDWQRLSTTHDETLIFSAHYDTRWRPAPLIRVIGISPDPTGGSLLCRVWFSDSDKPLFSQATVEIISETHGRRFVEFTYLHTRLLILQPVGWIKCTIRSKT